MKLLIDARPLVDPYSGGVRRVGIGLVEAICHEASQDEITLLTTGREKREIPFTLPPNTKRIHLSWPNKLLSASLLMGCSLERFLPERYDAYFFPNLGFTGPLKTPYSSLVHDLSFLIEPRWFSIKDRLWHRAVNPKRFMKQASAIFTVSDKTTNDLERYIGGIKQSYTISMAHKRLAHTESVEKAPAYFFAMSSEDKRKNLACLIEAMDVLTKEFPVQLYVTGSGTWNRPFVKALGRLSDQALANYVQGAKAVLYPSWYEGYGLPVHEARNLGTPVIASIAGALPETVPPGTKLIQPEKPQLWLTAMKSMFLSDHTNEPITQEHSWQEAAKIIVNKLREVSHPSNELEQH